MNPSPPKYPRQGFSLIECVIALGLLAFALVAMIGMLPIGLAQFKASKEETVQVEILKFIDTQVQQTEFANLASALQAATFAFNEEGFPVGSGSIDRLYVTETSVSVGGVALPAGAGLAAESSLAGLARVDVTIFLQPAGLAHAQANVLQTVAIIASDRGQ